jgi:rhodanese-related sulfurtransferase
LEQEKDESFDRYHREFDRARRALLEPYQQKLNESLSLLTEVDARLRAKESIHLCGDGGVSYAPYMRNERLWPATLTVSDSLMGEFTVDVFIDFVGLVQSEEEIRFSIIDFDKAVKDDQLCWELAYHVIPDTRIDDEGLLEIVRFLLVLDEIRVFRDHAKTLFHRVFVDPILIRAITVDERLFGVEGIDDCEHGLEAAGYTDWFGNSGPLRSSLQHILLADPLTPIDVGYEQKRLSVLGPSIVVTADTLTGDAATKYFAALSASNNIMASAELKAMLDDNPDAVVLVDIRSAADFEAGHIEGAYHSAWADLGAVMEKIPTNRQVVIVCYSGQTASQALGALRLAGFTNAKVLTGGMNGWKGAGLEGTETGMRALAERSTVSSAKNDEQQVLWDAAKAYYKSVGSDGNKIIAPQALHDALDTNPKAFRVIDIRGKSDWDEGHIVGSTHVAWAQFAAVLPSLSKSEKVVIVCFSGQTAGQTVGVLRTLGYDAYSLQGGMNNGWKPAKLPMVTYP